MDTNGNNIDQKRPSTIPERSEPESPDVSEANEYERDPRLAQFAADFLRDEHQGPIPEPREEQAPPESQLRQQRELQSDPQQDPQPKPASNQLNPPPDPQSDPPPDQPPKPQPELSQSQNLQSNTAENEEEPEIQNDQLKVNAEKRHSSESGTLRNSPSNSPSFDDGSSNQGENRQRYKPMTGREREKSMRMEDEEAVQEAEQRASVAPHDEESPKRRVSDKGFPREPRDEGSNSDPSTIKEQAAYIAPVNREEEKTPITHFFMKVKNFNIVARWLIYILPITLILLVPLLLGAIPYPNASIGGVKLLWFSVWLEIIWLTLWAGRIAAKLIPFAVVLLASFFTYEARKWGEMARRLETPFTTFFWWLGIEISFLPTMKHHHINGSADIQPWETIVNRLIIVALSMMALFLVEKIIIRLIAVAFHMRTYSDRIEVNRFQIGSLTKLYTFSKGATESPETIYEKQEASRHNPRNGPQASDARSTRDTMGSSMGNVAGDFTRRNFFKSGHPQKVVLALLQTTAGSHVLARRIYRTFVPEDSDNIRPDNFKEVFDSPEELDAAFSMFDKEVQGDIAIDELEGVCVEVGRERRSILASLKDLDSVVGELDKVLTFVVLVLTLIIFLCLISQKTAGVLATTGSTILGLSWLFSTTAQELLQSIVFIFAKHPFDVGDRVCIYGNTGPQLTGDDYYVKKISLLYTEFKKLEGNIVQAPNGYLNQLFIMNHRRSGNLAECIPMYIRFGTTLEQMDELRTRLLEFVRSEKREYYPNILTELRTVDFAFSVTLSVVFFYRSNWQNDLLRLQRRNKFICHLMLTLMDLGIESPIKNFPGARLEAPWYMASAQSQPFAPMGSVAPTPGNYDQGSPRREGPDQSTYDDRSRGPGTESAQGAQSQYRPSMGAPSVSRQSSTSGPQSLDARKKRHYDYSLGVQPTLQSGRAPEPNDVGEDQHYRRLTTMARSINRAEDTRSRRPNRPSARERPERPPRPSNTSIGDIEAGQAFGPTEPVRLSEVENGARGQNQHNSPDPRVRDENVAEVPPTRTEFRQPDLQANDDRAMEQAVSPRVR